MRKYTPEQRINVFWSRVNKNGSIPKHLPELGNCWEWTAYCNSDGYGHHRQYKTMLSCHRISWELEYGSIPDGLWVLHKCDNRKCVRPDHLFLGTHQDNMSDMVAKKRVHPHDGENNPKHKLTRDQVIEIRQRYAVGGIYQYELAAEYGTWQAKISEIILYKTWKDVP